MERTLSKQAIKKIGEKVMLKGWLHSLRLLGSVNFLIVRDREGLVQVVVQDKEQVKILKDLQPGSILIVNGEVQKAEKTELGIEIINPEISVEKAVTEPWPVEINKPEIQANYDTILDYRPITLRNEQIAAVFKVQATILEAYREFLVEKGFTEFMGPSIISASSEGGSELFTVDYFGYDAKLAQSNQLYKQMMVGVYERVFGSLKCFRAEKSNTRRHLTEATQLEFEIGFIEKFEDVLEWEERVVKAIIKKLYEKLPKEMALFPNASVLPEDVSIPRFTLKEVLELYYKETGKDERNEIDMSPDSERFISEYSKKNFGTDMAFVTHFPRVKCAFYAKPNEENPEVCNYGDLICNGTEVSSGGQRIEDYNELVESLKMKELDPANFKDYLMIFKYGMPKHGGFGLGLERFTLQLLGLENIRQTTLFPSDTKRIAAVPFKRNVSGEDNIVGEIKKTLERHGIKYEFFEHEATVTSEDAARVRGTKPEEGVKALILKGKKSGKNIMVCLQGNAKIDMKKATEVIGEKLEFEKPEMIKEKYGLEVGGVPPFGNLLGLDVYFDEKVEEEEYSSFNCGSKFKSIRMKSKDLVEVVGPVITNLSA